MKIAFWMSVVWLIYVYAGYPVLVWVMRFARRVNPAADNKFMTSVSVLISARNEERDIGWKIRQTLDWNYPADKLEVLIASDASDDATDAILSSINDQRVRYLRTPQRIGKNAALNCLSKLATGELLLFTDANTNVGSECLRLLVRNFADPRVGCVTGVENTVCDGKAGAIDRAGGTYLDYESVVNEWESRIGSVLVCDGSLFCIRRSLFVELQPDLANDLELPIHIGSAGNWVVYEPQARSQEYATRSVIEEFKRRKRICAQGMLGAWRLRSHLRGLRGWQFLSRKVLRWFSLAPFATMLITSAALSRNLGFAAIFEAQVVFLALAVAGLALCSSHRSCPLLFSAPFYFLLATSAAMQGALQSCFGRRFGVWEVAQLSRGRAKAAG